MSDRLGRLADPGFRRRSIRATLTPQNQKIVREEHP
jgi:hypothetical protein